MRKFPSVEDRSERKTFAQLMNCAKRNGWVGKESDFEANEMYYLLQGHNHTLNN